MRFLVLLVLAVSCSSAPEKKDAEKELSKINNSSFKKDKTLSNSEVKDYYQVKSKTTTPALQDETIDRFTPKELELMNAEGDSLLEISLLCSRREFKSAFELASRNFNKYQKVAGYWNQIANCHLNAQAHRKALLFYNKSLEVDPNYVPALNNIGVMYSRQGQDQKALVAFERASRQSKFSKTPKYNLAQLYLKYGLADSALPIFEGLQRSAPNDWDILNSIATVYFLKSDYQKALSVYQTIPVSEWRRPEVAMNLSLTFKHLGMNNEAQSVFKSMNTPSQLQLKQYYSKVKVLIGAAE